MRLIRSSDGFTLVELLVVVALIGILSALTAPFLMEAKASSNEASAIGSLRALNSGQSSYAASCARGSYAVDVQWLIDGAFLSEDMGYNPRAGYNFALADGDGAVDGPTACDGETPKTSYYATGVPLSATTGRRGFASNQAGTIWQDLTGVAPVEPFAVNDTVAPIQ